MFFLDENPESFRRAARNPPKHKESESGQSGSGGSDSGSDSSGSGDSDSDSDSDSSASETSRGVKKPMALQIRNLSARSNGEILRYNMSVPPFELVPPPAGNSHIHAP